METTFSEILKSTSQFVQLDKGSQIIAGMVGSASIFAMAIIIFMVFERVFNQIRLWVAEWIIMKKSTTITIFNHKFAVDTFKDLNKVAFILLTIFTIWTLALCLLLHFATNSLIATLTVIYLMVSAIYAEIKVVGFIRVYKSVRRG